MGQTVLEVRCDEVRLGGHNQYVARFRTADGPAFGDGWTLTTEEYGILAAKEGRRVLVPWTRVHSVEFEPEPEPKESKESAPRRPGS